MLRSFFLLMLAVLACSSAAVMLKASNMRPEVVSALRLLLASLVLYPVFLKAKRKHGDAHFTRSHSNRTWYPALALAGHFILWAYGAHVTLTAQASLIVNLVPVALPFFLYAFMREHINLPEILATLLALTGLAILTGRDAMEGSGNLWGNLSCFVSMLFLACYMSLARLNRDFASIWLYVVPVYFRAGLICLLISLPRLLTLREATLKDFLILLALVFIPTILGHSLMNFSMRNFRGQIVSLANTGQFIFAGSMGWLFFQELPRPIFYLASLFVLAGIALAIRYTPAAPSTPEINS